jgi:5'-3' exonuclease
MDVYLIDGTYELFRHYFAVPSAKDDTGREVGAVRGVLTSLLGMMRAGETCIGVATDHVIESFRNAMWAGYKTSAGVPADLLAQFPLLEEALAALGVTVWPMVEFEADDALASAAALAAADARVDRVLVCTPDKDLAQVVSGTRVVQMDRRARSIRDEAGVVAKFGVPPASIPDYLALVGDTSDGYPGLPGWGAKSAAAVLARFGSLENIPADWTTWAVNASRPAVLAATLAREREHAFRFRELARLRTDLPLFSDVNQLRWAGPTSAFAEWGRRLQAAK